MKQRIFTWFAVMGFSFSAALFFNSCKEDTILGSNVIPVDDTANTILIGDTLDILTRTVLADSLRTSLSVPGVPIYHALGAVTTDPYSGRTTAGFYLQLVPPSLGYSFPKRPDSAFLVLPYAGFTWGDTTMANMDQTIRVYEIAANDSILKDSSYYFYSHTAVDAVPVSEGNQRFGFNANGAHGRIRDSVSVLGQNRAPHLRIRLTQAFLDKIADEAAKPSGSALAGYAEFLQFQRGLYVTTADSNTGNALYYFVLNGGTDFTRANVQFFYTEEKDGGGDTVRYTSFFFDQNRNAHYNRITRNYSGTPTGTLLNAPAASAEVVVLQNEPGAALELKIPNISKLPKQPIVKAELVITQVRVAGDMADIYSPPARLFPVRMNGKKAEVVQDRYPVSSIEPLNFMDGLRKDVVINGSTYSQYTINLPMEIQRAIVEQRDTLHLRISGAATFPGAYRLIMAGRENTDPNLRLKLRIYYSKI